MQRERSVYIFTSLCSSVSADLLLHPRGSRDKRLWQGKGLPHLLHQVHSYTGTTCFSSYKMLYQVHTHTAGVKKTSVWENEHTLQIHIPKERYAQVQHKWQHNRERVFNEAQLLQALRNSQLWIDNGSHHLCHELNHTFQKTISWKSLADFQ